MGKYNCGSGCGSSQGYGSINQGHGSINQGYCSSPGYFSPGSIDSFASPLGYGCSGSSYSQGNNYSASTGSAGHASPLEEFVSNRRMIYSDTAYSGAAHPSSACSDAAYSAKCAGANHSVHSAYSHSMKAQQAQQDYQAAQYNKNNYNAARIKPAVTFTKLSDINMFFDPSEQDDISFSDEELVMDSIRDCFEKTTGKRFPVNIKIHLFSPKSELLKHIAIAQDVLGFALNSKGKVLENFILPHDTIYFDANNIADNELLETKVSEIFIKLGSIERMLIVAGHELGHVLTPQLKNKVEEEAKAFSFMLEWLNTIKLHNIAGLGAELKIPSVANNNLHDKALEFVLHATNKGWKPMNVFRGICEGLMKINYSD